MAWGTFEFWYQCLEACSSASFPPALCGVCVYVLYVHVCVSVCIRTDVCVCARVWKADV